MRCWPPRAHQAGLPEAGFTVRRPARSLATGEPDAGASAAVPDAHRLHGAAGRRRRRRQRGGDLHRRRRKVIAAFKSLGATSRTVLWIHLLQVMMIAVIGIVVGIALGFSFPSRCRPRSGDACRSRPTSRSARAALLTAVGYGFAGIAAVRPVAAGAGRAGTRRRCFATRWRPSAFCRAGTSSADAGCGAVVGGLGVLTSERAISPSTTASAWSASSRYSWRSAGRSSPGRRGAWPDRVGPSWRSPSATSVHRAD